jgi:hypothetical protein
MPPPLRAARTRVFKVLLTGFLAKAFFKPLGVFTAQALSEIAFQQAIGTTGTQDFLLSHSHTAWDVILSLFFHTPFTTQDFLLAFDHLKKWFRGVSGKKKGLVRIHGCVHYQSVVRRQHLAPTGIQTSTEPYYTYPPKAG